MWTLGGKNKDREIKTQSQAGKMAWSTVGRVEKGHAQVRNRSDKWNSTYWKGRPSPLMLPRSHVLSASRTLTARLVCPRLKSGGDFTRGIKLKNQPRRKDPPVLHSEVWQANTLVAALLSHRDSHWSTRSCLRFVRALFLNWTGTPGAPDIRGKPPTGKSETKPTSGRNSLGVEATQGTEENSGKPI